MDGSVPGLPEGNYCRVKKADLLPFLERTLVPAARAYQEYGASSMEEWNWHETEDGYVYVDVTGLTATLPYHLKKNYSAFLPFSSTVYVFSLHCK